MLTTEMYTYDTARSIALQPDGRIVVGGSAEYSDGIGFADSIGALARYLSSNGPADADADGVLDSGTSVRRSLLRKRATVVPIPAIRFAVLVPGDRYRAFAGELRGGCIEGSRVRIFKIKRGGRRVKVGQRQTFNDPHDSGGTTGFPRTRTRGRYYAKVEARSYAPAPAGAARARSPTLRAWSPAAPCRLLGERRRGRQGSRTSTPMRQWGEIV